MMNEEEIRTAVHNCAIKAGCEKCPYREHYGYIGGCIYGLVNDVDRLLQNDSIEREAHIICLEAFLYGNCDPFKNGCVWLELYPCGLAPAFFDCSHANDIRFLSLYVTTDGNNKAWFSGDLYGKTWRCWSARPTEEQRRETKWKDACED